MYQILTKLTKATTAETRVAVRAQIILRAFHGAENREIAPAVGLGRQCVGRWRRRWRDSFDALLAVEMREPKAALERAVADMLRDAHRRGAPGKFTAEQVVQLVSLACESPRDCGRPVDDWTGRELADEMQQRAIVRSISVARVNELLREVDLQPHTRKCWCFTTEKDPGRFQTQVQEVCQTYLQAASAHQRDGAHTVCTDEMTSLQANERRAAAKRPRPGRQGKREHQYTRHGALSLTGSWHVVLGQMIHTTVAPTRTGADFAEHLDHTIQTDPDAPWIFVMDNLNTHSSEEVVRWAARRLDVSPASLGDKKKRRGILGSAQTRRAFLSDPAHRIRFVFLPKHSSWLNQIEVVFGIISRRVMRHGSFTSTDDLQTKLLDFLDYFNRTFATPFHWTYTGKPTRSTDHQRPRTWREKTQSRKMEQILALVA